MGDRAEDRQHDQGARSLTDVSKRSSLMYTDVHGSMNRPCTGEQEEEWRGINEIPAPF